MQPSQQRFLSLNLIYWLGACFFVLLLQMYLNTGTLSAYAATLDKPALYNGYYVNYDWPQYVANYNFIRGEDHSVWENGLVLRRILLYVIGFPFLKIFGFYAGSLITIVLTLLTTFFFFFRFVEREFGEFACKVAMLLLGSYSGIMYWIGSPFVQNLVVPLSLIVYMLLYQLHKKSLYKKTFYLTVIGVLFTGYDLLPLFAPGILLYITLHKSIELKQKLWLLPITIVTFLLPQLLIKLWLTARGANTNTGNEEAYKVIITAYTHILNDLPAWYIRIKNVPETLLHCFFRSNFYVLPLLFIFSWFIGRWYLSFKLNLLERCLLLSVLFLFLFNNIAPPYEGEWQMWGDWLARLYQAVFVVYLLYIIRLAEHIYKIKKMLLFFNIIMFLAVLTNVLINTGGLYASSLSNFVYSNFYLHGSPNSYSKNIIYYGARPLGFPVHYNSEIKDETPK